MLLQPYSSDELQFAYCYRLYIRCRTHRLRVLPELSLIDEAALREIGDEHGIRFLEHSAGPTDLMALVSLRPGETAAACVSKFKGKISKRLSSRSESLPVEPWLSRGYFACTTGKSDSTAVEQYLSAQGEHHGYADRKLPPVFVRSFSWAEADEAIVRAKHSCAVLQHHIVLATWRRKGVFLPAAAEAVVDRWDTELRKSQAVILKASFVPDHVHLAVRVHPSVSPGALIPLLMNEAQHLVWNEFDDLAIRAGVERLWQPSAYLGSFGDLTSPKISQYIRDWNP